ncbi:hypothetical protein Tco_0969950 [Tanacetum coccineum]
MFQTKLNFENSSSNNNPNPEVVDEKRSTTRSCVAYEVTLDSTNPSPKKDVDQATESGTEKSKQISKEVPLKSYFRLSPFLFRNPMLRRVCLKPRPNPESDISKSLPKPNISYPSRRDDQKSRDKALNQMEKSFQIFQDLRFNISFADALLLRLRNCSTIKSLLMNKEKLLE